MYTVKVIVYKGEDCLRIVDEVDYDASSDNDAYRIAFRKLVDQILDRAESTTT